MALRLGSTVPYVVERIYGQGELNKDRVFIPTGPFPNLSNFVFQ